jgi:hypothetical protein
MKDVQTTREASSALKKEHNAIQNMIFLMFYFCVGNFFAHLNPDRIPNADPDPANQINADPQH